jgi:TPR repeat protein
MTNPSILSASDGSSGLLDAHISVGSPVQIEDVGIDFQKAVHYFKLAADQGVANAQFWYGFCLDNGRGVAIDLPKAAHYYKLAADQGVPESQLNYGFCLDNGRGVPID